MGVDSFGDLQPTEAELLADDESYMDYLSEDELGLVAGGLTPTFSLAYIAAGAISSAVGSITGSKQMADWIENGDK
jgi:hypothetical protein